MTYSLNPFDPFADDEASALIVLPERTSSMLQGKVARFVKRGYATPFGAQGAPVIERRCSVCERSMLIPDSWRDDATRVLVYCPDGHESETVDIPAGFVRM